jgi:hypothetical protein
MGIHAGLLSILTSVFSRLLADPLAFSEIGDPSEETDNLPLFSRIAVHDRPPSPF